MASTASARSQNSSQQQQQRNRNVAVARAFVIHHQKDIEAQILTSIERLADLPERESPTSGEAQSALEALSIFQPADYSDLVTERNSQARCGYVLCAKEPRSRTSKTPLSPWRRQGEKVGFEDYCSDICLEKSTWLRAQLPGEPAWERRQSPKLTLHPHDRQLASPVAGDLPSATREAGMTELARERGDAQGSFKPGEVLATSLIERPSVRRPQNPVLEDGFNVSRMVDNYNPVNPSISEPKSKPKSPTPDIKTSQITDNQEDEQQWSDMFEHLKITTPHTRLYPDR